ncbi:HDOD domain-containing protein [Alteromonas sp. ASW11-130]|uniref:HDOD domain-containing protein n=1 Tax=Alteromonas sp. ASW11-130 TaxID=3015775 RepID=UPI002241B3BC|nr:HDOD domain-containing protein [Alteromonas sp. ASW11-130]MCW8091590.1 HDOD domain-containing protein [Alteromonas sp. ASW11-130]
MSLTKYVTYASQSFTLPDICLRIRDILDDHRSDADDIAKLISVDPSLTAKILRLANSALFRFPSQIGSISKAVNVIGGEALYNLVVAETANTAFAKFDSPLVNQDQHWRNSVYCGMVAKYLAKNCRIRGIERFFVMGILQNLSELVIAKCSPDKYENYLNDDSDLLPWEKQLNHFKFTFAQCSGTIMESWRLPLALYFPVIHLHDKKQKVADAEIAVLAVAVRTMFNEQQQEEDNKIEFLPPELEKIITIQQDTLDDAIHYSRRETDMIASLVR